MTKWKQFMTSLEKYLVYTYGKLSRQNAQSENTRKKPKVVIIQNTVTGNRNIKPKDNKESSTTELIDVSFQID